MKPTSVLALLVWILGVSLGAGCGSSDPDNGQPQGMQLPNLIQAPNQAPPDWTRMSPARSPSPRSYGASAVIGDEQVLLFGGYASDWTLWGHQQDDTWVYNLAGNTWTDKNPSTNEELKGRYRQSVAPLGNGKALLFGGYRFHRLTPVPDALNETWVYDLGTNRWTRKRPATLPEERYWAGLAGIGANRALLFGGSKHGGSHEMDDTWVYDAAANTWTRKNPPAHPSSREGHAMSSIGDDKVVNKPPRRAKAGMAGMNPGEALLFGGTSLQTEYMGDTWVFTDPFITWNRRYLPDQQASVQSIQQTTDGGYVMAGSDTGFGPQTDTRHPRYAAWLNKVDEYGNMEWDQAFADDGMSNMCRSIQQTSDGGYVMVGDTYHYACTGTHCTASDPDVLLIKTDASGNKQWGQALGGEGTHQGYAVRQTRDGGYVVTGTSQGADGKMKLYLLKTDENGDPEWAYAYLTSGGVSSQGNAVEQTADGGYIAAGALADPTPDSIEGWLVRTGPDGTEQWNRILVPDQPDAARAVCLAPDGGYVVAGYAWCPNSDHTDGWLVKVNAAGTVEEWQWTGEAGGFLDDALVSVKQTFDGNLIAAGWTYLPGDTKPDAWLIKFHPDGTEAWDAPRTFGAGVGAVQALSVDQASDGGYVLGATGGSTATPEDPQRAWAIKTDPYGNAPNEPYP